MNKGSSSSLLLLLLLLLLLFLEIQQHYVFASRGNSEKIRAPDGIRTHDLRDLVGDSMVSKGEMLVFD